MGGCLLAVLGIETSADDVVGLENGLEDGNTGGRGRSKELRFPPCRNDSVGLLPAVVPLIQVWSDG